MIISPNPNNGIFNILVTKNKKRKEINIYNVMGELVYLTSFNDEQKTISFKANAGIYFVQVRDNETQYLKKIVVE